jgi:glycosyltransferase 2 family protein
VAESSVAPSVSSKTRVRSVPSVPPALRWVPRIAIGAVVVVFLLARGSPSVVAHVISTARPGYLVAAMGAMLGVLVVSAFRWDVYLRTLGIALRRRDVVRLYFVGAFFNGFLPTGVGGDAYKVMRLRPLQGSILAPTASVILDRMSGFVGLAVVCLIGSAARFAQGDDGVVVRVAAPLGLAVLVGIAMCFVLGDRLTRRERSGRDGGIVGKVRTVVTAVGAAGRAPGGALTGLALGLASGALILVFHWLLAQALGLRVPLGALAAIGLLAVVATLAPMTINGVGFREAAYVWGLNAYSIAHDQALAFALLAFSGILATSLLGGLVYAVAGGRVESHAGTASASPSAARTTSPGTPAAR